MRITIDVSDDDVKTIIDTTQQLLRNEESIALNKGIIRKYVKENFATWVENTIENMITTDSEFEEYLCNKIVDDVK